MQELRLVAVSEDGTYLVLATAGRGTRFTLPVDDRLRAAVRGNFSRLGQYEIEVESPLRPKEIQARIRAGETAEEIAATAGIPVERVRWFEGPVLQEREYVAQQAQRVAVRMPGESAPGPTLGDLVAERLTRRGVPTDEIDWDSAKRDDGLWRVKLGYVWNGHTRHAEWLFDPRKRHVTPHDDEALRLSSADFDPEPAVVEDTTVMPFAPRVAKLQPVPPLASDALPFPSVVRREPEEPAVGYTPPVRSPETAYTRPPETPPREAPFAPGPRQDYDQGEEPAAHYDTPARDSGHRADPGHRQDSVREPYRPEPPARETGHTRPGDTSSRRGGSSPWLPDFGAGRSGDRETDSIYAPAAPPSSRPTPWRRPSRWARGRHRAGRPACARTRAAGCGSRRC
ncbi:septation protein SepH, partial [Nonomuraea fuscirosea]